MGTIALIGAENYRPHGFGIERKVRIRRDVYERLADVSESCPALGGVSGLVRRALRRAARAGVAGGANCVPATRTDSTVATVFVDDALAAVLDGLSGPELSEVIAAALDGVSQGPALGADVTSAEAAVRDQERRLAELKAKHGLW